MLRGYFLDSAAPELHSRLVALLERRAVFFAGLPGTGKSLLVLQLAHLAADTRRIDLLQWDVLRPPFEACEAGQAYPQVEGVTHPLIRRAAGLWARDAVARWHAESDASYLLIGELPLAGNRLIELVEPRDDAAEALLASEATAYVLPVPSVEVRRHIEAERVRRIAAPVNDREREDAPPNVLHDLWLGVLGLGRELGFTSSSSAAYDPSIYEAVSGHLLRHRTYETLKIDTLLPVAGLSVYDFAVEVRQLMPTEDEATQFIRLAESNP